MIFLEKKEWIRLSKNNLPKLLKSKDLYSLYKYDEYLFLVKDNNYIAYMDGITDKLDGKKSFYITVMHSGERGSMDILFDLMKDSGYKYIVSDTMLSNDAIKYYEKLMKRHKYFGVDYRDENVKIKGATHIPPDYLIVPELMEKLIINYEDWKKYHPIIRAALLHGELVKIHPFIDENEPLGQQKTYLQKYLQNKGFTDFGKSFF